MPIFTVYLLAATASLFHLTFYSTAPSPWVYLAMLGVLVGLAILRRFLGIRYLSSRAQPGRGESNRVQSSREQSSQAYVQPHIRGLLGIKAHSGKGSYKDILRISGGSTLSIKTPNPPQESAPLAKVQDQGNHH